MFRKKTDENREILLQSFYNLEDKITEKIGKSNVSIAFTASSKDTQKEENIVNIARHLVEDGNNILIIDANLRDSDFDLLIKKPNDRGFIDVILGGYDIDSLVETDDEFDNLVYLNVGKVIDYADNFLEPKIIKNFLKDISNIYDYVFMNLSENTDIAEANMFAANADYCLVFAKDELSFTKTTQKSMEQLEKANANILGIVITGYEYGEDELDDLFGGYDE